MTSSPRQWAEIVDQSFFGF